jgi:hypothetical protein
MAFILISIGCFKKANGSVSFHKGMCTIKDPEGCTIATILCANGPYHLIDQSTKTYLDHANIAAGKMSISEVHYKLKHISHTAIKHVILTGQITKIELDMNSKSNFCKPYVEATIPKEVRYSNHHSR